MELDEFMVVVTMLSLLIGLCGLLLNLTNKWAHKPDTIIVETQQVKVVNQGAIEFDQKIADIERRLFDNKRTMK